MPEKGGGAEGESKNEKSKKKNKLKKRREIMKEKGKKYAQFALGRRDFLKMGLAGGLVAGIPMGIIPKVGSCKGYAEVVKGSKAVEKIPAEARWTIATQGLTGAYVATVKAMLDAVGRDKYSEMMVQIWTEAGKSSKQIADALGLAGHDAKSAAQTGVLVCIASMGPEFEFEIIEATAEKAAFRYHECPWWNRMKELGISDDLCSAACPAYWNGSAKSFNPKLTASLAKAKPWGDPFCEYVYKLQK